MKVSRIQSIILHLAATMLLSCGFVKTADKIDALYWGSAVVRNIDLHPDVIGTLPCGTSKTH